MYIRTRPPATILGFLIAAYALTRLVAAELAIGGAVIIGALVWMIYPLVVTDDDDERVRELGAQPPREDPAVEGDKHHRA